ncbi:hypothetical protein H4219_001193 [Mycoemilia scoparia]|uniref:CID domain-containing protein n=1 Tax=Mycoemilia scoparia TaxID=417184 RepID=A0A9W8A5B5_9FUNG|nr:hypothetical protein H4219_001193 [Mycoemilia scoparia]
MDDADPFETRLLFGGMIRGAAESCQSISQVAEFAIVNIEIIDILYNCIEEQIDQENGKKKWIEYLEKDLETLITKVVPESHEGNTNLTNASKMVASWRKKRAFPFAKLDALEKLLRARGNTTIGTPANELDKGEIMKRIENDRNVQKSQKIDMWIRPTNESEGQEFEEYWENVSDMNDDDLEEIQESIEGYRKEMESHATAFKPISFR